MPNMAIIYVKFERIFYILRVFGTFTNIWPARPNIKKNELFLRDLYYYSAIFIFMAAVWIPMIIKTYKSRNDVSILMKNISHIAALTEAIFNSILCRIKKRQLQSLLMSIEKFMEISKYRERIVLQKYVNRYAMFISTVAISFFVAGITVIFSPLFLSQEFPLDVWYPFSTESLLRKFILYIMQIFTITQTVFCLDVDIMIAVILFYSTVKLEILASEVEQATNEIDIISCIRKHQEIIK
ncbi:uncharacterized protein LOC112639857 [Camponotus floridanus]|nr:uncharacterized protein LOC112639857 [Camponotus floridanus]